VPIGRSRRQGANALSDGAFLATIDESGGTAEGMYVSACPSAQLTDSKWFEATGRRIPYLTPTCKRLRGCGYEGAAKPTRSTAIRWPTPAQTPFPLSNMRFEPNGDLVEPKIWIYQVRRRVQQVE
jgi:branched-chain amino acid transport system substrate-binding protein